MRIRYHGISAFEVATEEGDFVLIDPGGFLGEASDALPPVAGNLRCIAVTHAAWDHLGKTLAWAQAADAPVAAGPDVTWLLRHEGIAAERLRSMVPGARRRFGPFELQALAASHVSMREWQGHPVTGVPLGYIVRVEGRADAFYHLGDTAISGDLKLYSDLYQVRAMAVPVGSVPGGNVEMTPEEAATIVRWFHPRVVFPMHWQSPAEDDRLRAFQAAVQEQSSTTRVIVLHVGDAHDV